MSSGPKVAFPGEELGTTEEYIPGEGTYEEDGRIFSSLVGDVICDHDNLTISVRSKNPPVVLQKGDHVITRVIGLYESMVLVEVLMVDGNERAIAGGDTTATIHVSKIDRKYTDDVSKEYRRGDIVRAEVIQSSPSIELVTNYPHLGVIRGLCVRCRFPLVRKGKDLECSNCSHRETRKLADDFGNVRFTRRGE